jgi:aldehyde dehydrogenase (NAD+)
MQEEIFGPLLPIISYQTLPELYQNIDSLPNHPLALYLFTQSALVEQEVLNSKSNRTTLYYRLNEYGQLPYS